MSQSVRIDTEKWLVLLEKLLSVKLNMSMDKGLPFLLQVICGSGIPATAHVKEELEPASAVELLGNISSSTSPTNNSKINE